VKIVFFGLQIILNSPYIGDRPILTKTPLVPPKSPRGLAARLAAGTAILIALVGALYGANKVFLGTQTLALSACKTGLYLPLCPKKDTCENTDGWPLGNWYTQGVQVAQDVNNRESFSQAITFLTDQTGIWVSSKQGTTPDTFTVDVPLHTSHAVVLTLISANPDYHATEFATISPDGCSMSGTAYNYLKPKAEPFIVAYFQYCWHNDNRCTAPPKEFRPPIIDQSVLSK
jgi:hypothetical protein